MERKTGKSLLLISLVRITERTQAPLSNGICIKLSVDHLQEYDGCALILQTLAQYLRGGASFARRLGNQTFGGGTDLLEQAAQLER